MIVTDVKLVDINFLRPHEDIDEANLTSLTEKIHKNGAWDTPIIIDKESGIIMDGHHRYNFALTSGLSRVPCYEMSYSSEKVRVYDWKTGLPFAYQQIFKSVESGKIFPSKTTRHDFSEQFATVNIELTRLY